MKIKQFILYLLKWELGTLIMSPTIYLLSDTGPVLSVIVGNFIGALVFYPIDKKIFSTNKEK